MPERPEPWFNRCFWVCLRESQYAEHGARIPTGVRRGKCCDCRETIIITFQGTTAALLRPYLHICTRCAKQRELDDGPQWKYRVWPHYRHRPD